MSRERWLDNRVPPPLVALLCLLAMLGLATIRPEYGFVLAGQNVMTGLLAVAGLGVIAAGVLAFRKQGTTVDPLHPERATTLVAEGIYTYTRNPMYLGMTLFLLAAAVWTGQPPALAGPAAFVWWITRYQIEPEERALASAFGQSFADYCGQVRRWI